MKHSVEKHATLPVASERGQTKGVVNSQTVRPSARTCRPLAGTEKSFAGCRVMNARFRSWTARTVLVSIAIVRAAAAAAAGCDPPSTQARLGYMRPAQTTQITSHI